MGFTNPQIKTNTKKTLRVYGGGLVTGEVMTLNLDIPVAVCGRRTLSVTWPFVLVSDDAAAQFVLGTDLLYSLGLLRREGVL